MPDTAKVLDEIIDEISDIAKQLDIVLKFDTAGIRPVYDHDSVHVNEIRERAGKKREAWACTIHVRQNNGIIEVACCDRKLTDAMFDPSHLALCWSDRTSINLEDILLDSLIGNDVLHV